MTARAMADQQLLERTTRALLGKDDSEVGAYRQRRYLGRSGHSHEVDIALEFRKFGMDFLVAVQCKRSRRLVEPRDVLLFAEMLSDIGAQKGILVSVSGFLPGAVKAAEAAGISLLTTGDIRDQSTAHSPTAAARKRHGDLVDKKFTSSLSDEEAKEIEELEDLLDAADASLYEPVKQRLIAEIERLSSQRGKVDRG